MTDHEVSLTQGVLRSSKRRPFVLKREPRAIAHQLLQRTHQSQPPTDLEAVCSVLGDIKIVADDLEGDGYLLEYPDGSGEVIWNRRDLVTNKWRYTVAHEVGHWLTNRFADKSTPSSNFVEFSSEEQLERWCEKFAIALLVPSEWLQRYFGSELGLREARLFENGPNLFGVSRQAFYSAIFDEYKIAIVVCNLGAKSTIREIHPPFLAEPLRKAVAAGRAGHSPTVAPGEVWGPERITIPGSRESIRWIALASTA